MWIRRWIVGTIVVLMWTSAARAGEDEIGGVGACCVCVTGGESCVEVAQSICDAIGGVFAGDGTSCSTTACDEITGGACCLPDTLLCPEDVMGNPIEVTRALCEELGGIFRPCVSCTELAMDPCPILGACCTADGSCQEAFTFDECVGIGGAWQGFGTTCSDCAGACCVDDQCFVTDVATCLAILGTFAGEGSSCVDTDCDQRFVRRSTVVAANPPSIIDLDLTIPEVADVDRIRAASLEARSEQVLVAAATNLDIRPQIFEAFHDAAIDVSIDGPFVFEQNLLFVSESLDFGILRPGETRLASRFFEGPDVDAGEIQEPSVLADLRAGFPLPAELLHFAETFFSSGKLMATARSEMFTTIGLRAELVRVPAPTSSVWAELGFGDAERPLNWLESQTPSPERDAWIGLVPIDTPLVLVDGGIETSSLTLTGPDLVVRGLGAEIGNWRVTRQDEPSFRVGVPSGLGAMSADVTLDEVEVLAEDITIASPPASSTRLRLDAVDGTRLVAARTLSLGDRGTATLEVGGGATLLARDVSLGNDPGSFGRLVIEGDGDAEPDVDVPFFVIASRGEIDVRSGGLLRVGLEIFGGVFLFQEASLVGEGTVEGNVLNFGELDPGADGPPGATFTASGVYEQLGTIDGLGGGSGTLRINVAGADGPQMPVTDRLVVEGPAALGGGLVVTSDGAFDPGEGPLELPVLEATSIEGGFGVAFLPSVVPSDSGGQRFLRANVPQGFAGPAAVTLEVLELETILEIAGQDAETVDETPVALALADLLDENGAPGADGAIDLAVATNDGVNGRVRVFQNVGTGDDFVPGAQASYLVGSDPVDLIAAPLDGDGLVDLAVLDRTEGTVRTLVTVGADPLQFATGPLLDLGSGADPVAFANADLDLDGDRDLVIVDQAQAQVQFFGGNGDASFGFYQPPIILPPGLRPRRPDPADLDNRKEGIDVIVFALDGDETDDGVLGVLRRGAGGTFGNLETRPMPDGPRETVVADVDLDGLDDVLAIAEGDPSDPADPGSPRAPVVSVFLNASGGQLASPVNLPLDAAPRSFVARDLDGDGDRDLAVLTGESGAAAIEILRSDLVQAGSLTFAPDDVLDAVGATLLDAADLDADGLADLVTVNDGSGGPFPLGPGAGGVIEYRLNDLACPQDISGNGDVGFDDLVAILTAWGPCGAPPCPADITGDGEVGFDDLVALLSAWGPCD